MDNTKTNPHVANFSKKKHTKDKFKKFKGSRDEGQGFADKRKKKLKYEYIKLISKSKKKQQHTQNDFRKLKKPNQLEEEEEKIQENVSCNRFNIKGGDRFLKSKKEFMEKKKKKEAKKQEALQRKKEREKALTKYTEKRQNRHKKLCKRNYKGQPIMKNQIEYLLHKIEQGDKT